jgi:hypothetical protein
MYQAVKFVNHEQVCARCIFVFDAKGAYLQSLFFSLFLVLVYAIGEGRKYAEEFGQHSPPPRLVDACICFQINGYVSCLDVGLRKEVTRECQTTE